MQFKLQLLLVFCLGTTLSLTAQTAEEINRDAMAALAAYDTPGFAVGVIKDGKVVLSAGFGTRTDGKEEAVDGATLFAIASNSKAFISTSLTKLHVEGKLDLDEPVQTYLPYFQLYDPYVSSHTTVRDLLCHRVGLGTFSGDAIWYKSEKSAEEIIRQIRHLPQAYEWRAGYGYTNLMFITAGEVIRSVTGQSWAEYVRSNFFGPLGMSRSQTSVKPLAEMGNVATPHVTHRGNQPLRMAPWEASGAAGGIISSTDDMLKWLNAQLQEGTVAGKEIFPEKVLDQTFKVHNFSGGKLSFSSIGLGWFIYEREGKAVVTHGGGYDGMYSRVIMIPELELGIVVLSNSMTGLSSALGSRIRDLALGIDDIDWLTDATDREDKGRASWQEKFTAPKASRVMDTKPTVGVDDMVGTYADPLFGKFEVVRTGERQLELHFDRSPSLNATLSHWHYDTWKLEWHEPHAWFDFGTVQFLKDNRQQVSGLRFDVPNDDIFFEELEGVRE
ncbi:serine hydrolase [Neolewinella persica]|uniref:serine hydrolase n=1 Tax=Neolewinella persica TaxID=70998 RepID=UPI0012F782BF|nr:serine hydrolase [Neolewinella persica]